MATLPMDLMGDWDHSTGKERDTESGLDYFGKRYYGSNMGRWMSPDPINVTEDRMLNPSSTLNKYAYAANNPLKYIDPDGQDITYFYDPGEFAGHAVLFAYNQGNGQSAIESFGPNIHFVIGLGVSNFELGQYTSAQGVRDNFASVTVQTSPELTQEIVNYMHANPDPSVWFMGGPDCSSACSKILHKFKLDQQGFHGNTGMTPKALWYSMMARYNPSQAVWGHMTKPVQGRDYGNPRFDMFNLFFQSIRQQHEKVTSRIVPDSIKPIDQQQQ